MAGHTYVTTGLQTAVYSQPMGGEDIAGEQSQACDWSRGDWRLARATEVYPDRRGVVRSIEDCMKLKHGGTPTK